MRTRELRYFSVFSCRHEFIRHHGTRPGESELRRFYGFALIAIISNFTNNRGPDHADFDLSVLAGRPKAYGTGGYGAPSSPRLVDLRQEPTLLRT